MAYPLRDIMTKAWALARKGARWFGGKAGQYLAEALREAWLDAKGPKARAAAANARVLAEIERMKAEAAARPAPAPYVAPARFRQPFTVHRRAA